MTTKPTTEQIDALKTFASANGRTWKSKLREAWMTGNYRDYPGTDRSDLLQQVRNGYGPSWLVRFSLEGETVDDILAELDENDIWNEANTQNEHDDGYHEADRNGFQADCRNCVAKRERDAKAAPEFTTPADAGFAAAKRDNEQAALPLGTIRKACYYHGYELNEFYEGGRLVRVYVPATAASYATMTDAQVAIDNLRIKREADVIDEAVATKVSREELARRLQQLHPPHQFFHRRIDIQDGEWTFVSYVLEGVGEVATVRYEAKPFSRVRGVVGYGEPQATVNWKAIGAQTASVTRDVATILQAAAADADALLKTGKVAQ